jgi:hypothetical protein
MKKLNLAGITQQAIAAALLPNLTPYYAIDRLSSKGRRDWVLASLTGASPTGAMNIY